MSGALLFYRFELVPKTSCADSTEVLRAALPRLIRFQIERIKRCMASFSGLHDQPQSCHRLIMIAAEKSHLAERLDTGQTFTKVGNPNIQVLTKVLDEA